MPVYSSSDFSESSAAFKKQNVTLRAPNGKTIDLTVDVAVTPAQQQQGLMFRERLDEDTGMLFVFDQPRVLTFWMKNTLMPLDVLFFDANGSFVSVATMEPCVQDPCVTYPSEDPALYALEVQSGFARKHGVGPGWSFMINE